MTNRKTELTNIRWSGGSSVCEPLETLNYLSALVQILVRVRFVDIE